MHLKNLNKRISLTVLGILFLLSAFSQENFLQGFVVTTNGDTIYGFVDYRNWEKNPDNIAFKIQLTDKPISHTPLSIKSFGVADELYASGIVQIDLSPINTDKLEYGKELKIKIDTTFLQSIVLGKKSLYFYRNKARRELFYIWQDTSFVLLEYKRYLAESGRPGGETIAENTDSGNYKPVSYVTYESKTIVKENNRYLSQLAVYLKDCPTIQKEFAGLKYSVKSFQKLFFTYYDCVEKPMEFHKKEEKVRAEFGLIAGATFNNLEFTGDQSINLTNLDFKIDPSYSIGVYANLVLSRNQRKWSFYNELAFSPYAVDNYYEIYISENEYAYYTTTLGYSYLKLNSMARFTYPFGKTFVFINAGMSNGFAISETNQLYVEKKFYSTETEEYRPVMKDTRLYEQGIIAGLGGKYDKFSFEFRYERGNGMSAIMNLNSKTTRYLCLLGYKF